MPRGISSRRSRTARYFRASIGVFLALLLGALLLAINALQIASLALRPLVPVAVRGFNRALANFWWGLCVQLGTDLLKYEVVITGDPVPSGENALVFANHQEMPDIFVIMVFARSKNRLGDLKFFAKDILKYVPGVGWGLWMLDCVFLKRSWARDEARIRETFRKFNSRKIPFWLTFFPEGTRVRPHKLHASRRYAAQKGLPPLKHLLTPRTKGFSAAMLGLREKADAVYDLTIAYQGPVPKLWDLFTGRARKAHLDIRRFPVDSLPAGEPELSRWLIERFSRKDELLDFRVP